ncbi:hypothetical protein GF402_10470 [Candidatus Fermentibacteria bacterium]|nr:hypothetical protein [Candidatus Fermentibacteria bacterium]
MGRSARGIVAAAIAAAAWFVLIWQSSGYAIDDTYIHLQFAKNLATGNGLSFTAEAGPVYACTSPLWVSMLAVARLLGEGGLQTARILSSLFGAVSLVLLYVLSLRTYPRAGPLCFILLAANPWWIRWSASGMEATAASAVVLLAILMHTTGKPPWLVGLVCGLGYLVRPELAVLGPVLVLDHLLRRRRGSAAGTGVGFLLPVACWSVFALFYFGTALPEGALAKMSHQPLSSYLLGGVFKAGGMLAGSDLVLLLVSLVFVVPALPSRLKKARREGWMPMVMLPPAVLLLLLAGRAPIVSRYLLPAWPPLTLGMTACAIALTGKLKGFPRNTWIFSLGLLCMVWRLGTGVAIFYPHMRQMDRNLGVYRDIARYLRQETPEGSVIAVHEIGVFGYLGNRELLDLGGLVSPVVREEAFPGFDRNIVESLRLLKREGVTHYMDPHDLVRLASSVSDRSGIRFEPLESWSFPGGTAFTSRETYERVLYRVRVEPWSTLPTGAR